MTELETIKKASQDMGLAWTEYKATLDGDRANGVKLSGEVKAKLDKIDEALLKFEETKAKAERTLVAIQSTPESKGDPKDPKLTEYKANLTHYIRTGEAGPLTKGSHKEVKALSSLSNPDGGYYVTFDHDPEFLRNVVETSPVRQIARAQTIGNASIKGRRRTGRASTGGWVGEPETRPATGTPQVGEWEIFARELYAYPEAPQTFLEDSEIDAEAWLMEELNLEIPLQENTAFVNGNGVKRPRGFTTYPVVDPGDGTFVEKTDITTSNSLVSDDLFNVQGLLKEPYQAGASWAFTRGTLKAIRKLTATAQPGMYLWQPGLQLGAPPTLLDKPYTVLADMAELAAATTFPIAYGNWKLAYRVIDRRGITVLRDNLTNKPFVGFYVTKRVGGDVVLHEALKFLANK